MNPTAPAVRPWLLSLCVAAAAVPASAEPDEEAVRLKYTAPAQCPDATSFSAQVRERTARGRFAAPSELARTFNIKLAADARGFSGDLDFLDDGGAKVTRHVHGEDCGAVVSSLALITALALQPTSHGRDSEPVAPPLQASDASTLAEAPMPARAPVERMQVRPAGSRRRGLRAARLGVLAGYGSGASAPRLGALGQLDFRSGLAVRFTAHYAWHEFSVDAGRSARLQLAGVETSVCPWHFSSRMLEVAPCAAIDLGSFRAAGVPSDRLTSTSSETIGWASVAAQLGVSWELANPFWVELRAAAEFPLRAGYRFTFERPEQTAYRLPNVIGWGQIAAGVRFW